MSNEREPVHLFCHRCGSQLAAGRGNFYVVRIEAFADPSPPEFADVDLSAEEDLNREFDRLLDRMKNMSERELMDQVYRRLTLHLCGNCYRRWIENPAGQ